MLLKGKLGYTWIKNPCEVLKRSDGVSSKKKFSFKLQKYYEHLQQLRLLQYKF